MSYPINRNCRLRAFLLDCWETIVGRFRSAPQGSINQATALPRKLVREPVRWHENLLQTDLHFDLVTKHRTLILSEDGAANLIPPVPEDTVLIRILNPVHQFPPLAGQYAAVLECRFFDLESGSTEDETVACQAYRQIEKEASRILNFLNIHLDKIVVVHCHAGIARSAAVAQFALELRVDADGVALVQSDENVWAPNQWVLRSLRGLKRPL